MFKVFQKVQLDKIELVKKMKKYHEIKKQRGMTLLEIIIVLGIIGTIAAGVVVLAQRAFDSRAVSDVVSNTNTVRVAMKDAYQRANGYPLSSGLASTYDVDTIKKTDTAKEAIARLVQLGKLSIDEARNGISNDFINVGGAKTAANQGTENGPGLKGFVVEVNGLNQDQCRTILSQVANQWDYVKVGTAAAGSYQVKAAEDMTAAPGAGGEGSAGTILRSLAATGNVSITPDDIAGTCEDTPANTVILGSR
ncbi:type IV pilus major pilin [Morganella sp. EGD-HP17]|uniref:type IV pilus major pilin n=1 Tax=Morganella sp. EGD-HP17 TaxID=1435146 RepID=UPI000410F9E7|nr:type IV pilus major pilin [Morganella sp. EGD-HP17]ETO41265.1 structural subunit of longus pili [Morganella sp. EGD-HP17]